MPARNARVMSKTLSSSRRPARRGPSLATATAYLISQVGRSQVARFSEGLAPLGLRPKQFALLNLVDLHQGTSQQQLGEHLALEPSGLVKTIDELETQGLVERQRDPADRRRHALYLTQPGRPSSPKHATPPENERPSCSHP